MAAVPRPTSQASKLEGIIAALHVPRDRFIRRQRRVDQYVSTMLDEHLLLYITRNKNDNIVCYAPKGTNDAGTPMSMDVFWQDLATVAGDGMPDAELPRTALNFLERSQAYGVKVIADGDTTLVQFVAMPSRSFVLVPTNDKGTPACLKGMVDGRFVTVTRMHVDEEGGVVIPTVHGVLLQGVDLATGTHYMEYMKR